MENGNIDLYLEGKALYGDDFTQEQIAEWYTDEEEGYANLGAKDSAAYSYGYHAWNRLHAYRYLPKGPFEQVLGFGSAYGDELLPIISRVRAVTIVDPSAAFVREKVHGVHATYIKPSPSGHLSLPDDAYDLITCFGVLHHIPNVTRVVHELARVLKPGAHMVLREPIVSMGDWRQPRRGLTKRERGIPLQILEKIVRGVGLITVKRSLCGFPLTPRVFRPMRSGVYNSSLATWFDAALSRIFAWNVTYHARHPLQRLRPTAAFFVLRKAGGPERERRA
jgi:SAM-dependent methyltransferase